MCHTPGFLCCMCGVTLKCFLEIEMRERELLSLADRALSQFFASKDPTSFLACLHCHPLLQTQVERGQESQPGPPHMCWVTNMCRVTSVNFK